MHPHFLKRQRGDAKRRPPVFPKRLSEVILSRDLLFRAVKTLAGKFSEPLPLSMPRLYLPTRFERLVDRDVRDHLVAGKVLRDCSG